jgi:CBS domain-containing protein
VFRVVVLGCTGADMTVRELMTRSLACCAATTKLPEVARMMVAANCGCIPVVDEQHHLIGVVTDRDIVCRTIACDRNALELTAEDCMTEDCVVVTPEATVEYCCKLLEQDQIRRAVVVDTMGRVCGSSHRPILLGTTRFSQGAWLPQFPDRATLRRRFADPTCAPVAIGTRGALCRQREHLIRMRTSRARLLDHALGLGSSCPGDVKVSVKEGGAAGLVAGVAMLSVQVATAVIAAIHHCGRCG